MTALVASLASGLVMSTLPGRGSWGGIRHDRARGEPGDRHSGQGRLVGRRVLPAGGIVSTPDERNEQADLFRICLTGGDDPEREELARPAPRREDDRPQRPGPTR